jgi:hypothetical protein
MDDILQQIGVIQDNEESVLHRYLQSKGISSETAEENEMENQKNVIQSKRLLPSGIIAQSIIEKSLPDDFLPQDEDPAVSATPKAKKQKIVNKERPTIKLISLANEASLTKKEPRLRKPISELNNRLLEATDQLKTMKEKMTKPSSSLSSSRQKSRFENQKLPRSLESLPSASPQLKDLPLLYECPICERKFEVETAKASLLDSLVNKHIDRCLRRKINDVPSSSSLGENGLSSSSTLSPFSGDSRNKEKELLDFVSSEESEEETKRSQQRRSIIRSQRKKKGSHHSSYLEEVDANSKSEDDEYIPEATTSSREEEEYDNADDDDDDEDRLEKEVNEDLSLSNGTTGNLIGDDWEEEHFFARIKKIPSKLLLTSQTSYGAEMTTSVWNQLYDYQKEGTKWFYSLYCDGLGGILADEMGKKSYRQCF